jgi:hypothetical protein
LSAWRIARSTTACRATSSPESRYVAGRHGWRHAQAIPARRGATQ